jgi:RND family efflux transporter MFP subunit
MYIKHIHTAVRLNMKRWVYALLPLVILFSLIAWRVAGKRAEGVERSAMRDKRMKAAAPVSVAPAMMREISHVFEATGSVEAPLNVKIAPKVTGRVQYLQVREGDRVKSGQVLVRIDPSDVEAQVVQQRATLAEAQYRLAQAQLTENPTNVSVNTAIRQQQAGVESAKADFNQTSENYRAQVASANAAVTDMQGRVDNAKAGVKSAQANLQNANSRHNRLAELYKKGFVSAQDVDDSKTTVAVQEASVNTAQSQVDSALAQKAAAQEQASIVVTKGRADIESARARLAQAKASLEYAHANTAEKAAYKQSISALRAQVDAARAGLRNAETKRADTVLISPLDGFVTGRYVDPGAIATSGQPILAVQFMRQVWVTVFVPEEIAPKIHIGQPATLKFDAIPDRGFTGSVIQLNPSADPTSRQFMARVILSNSESLFKPGMFGRVSIMTDKIANALAVPREAVQTDRLGTYAMVVDDSGKTERRPIVTGASDPSYIAVEQGLRPGEKVVTLSAFRLREGQSVGTGGKPGGGFGRRRK